MSRTQDSEIVDIDATEIRFDGAAVASPTRDRKRPASASRLPLDSIEAVRREAARVYREMRSGALPAQSGTRLIYALGEISKLLVLGQLEARIDALEANNPMALTMTEDDRGDEEQPGTEIGPA